MVKHLYLVLALLLASESVDAAPISKDAARKKAETFAVEKGRTLSFTKSAVHKAPQAKGQETSPYYVFDMAQDCGFVIISGDDRTRSIIGYTEKGCYDEGTLPENMKSWLQMIADRITSLGDASTASSQSKHAKSARAAAATVVIPPLLTSTWNQGTPYWDNCPFRNGQRCYTGCTATAFAQVMYYYRWPEGATTSVPGYSDDGLNYSTLPSTTFDWNLMKNSYGDGDSGTSSGNAVAKLMHYVGKGALMHYTGGGSGAAFVNAINALKNYFGYPQDIYEIYKDNYSSSDWVNAVYAELYYGRPVLIEGYSDTNWGGGHAFVCDGYRDDGCFHINWGWGGWCDGYFSLDVLNPDDHSGMGAAPGGNGYYWHEGAVMNVRRPDGVGGGTNAGNAPVATFYQDINYGGYAVQLSEGTYTQSQLEARGIRNNDITSLKVLAGFKVTVFDGSSFNGDSKTLTSDCSWIGSDWNDRASSVKIEPNGVSGLGGIHKLKNYHSGKFMDLDANSTNNGTAIVQWDDEGTELYQQWRFNEIEPGVYTVQAAATQSRGLDIINRGTANGTQVILYDYLNGAHQQFIVYDKGAGWYQLVARNCGRVVEMPNASTTSGEHVQIWDNNNQACSWWQLAVAYTTADLTDFGGSCEVSHTAVNANEDATKLFDNNSNTKYCAFIGSTDEVSMTFHSTRSARLTSYAITSANDFEGRDPKNWRLEGSTNGTTWETIDTRSNETFSSRFEKKTYGVSPSKEYSHYRLVVTARRDAQSTVFQIAELEYFALIAQAYHAPADAQVLSIDERTIGNRLYEQTFDIYSVDGKLVKRAATSLEGLPKGIYVVNRKKMMIR